MGRGLRPQRPRHARAPKKSPQGSTSGGGPSVSTSQIFGSRQNVRGLRKPLAQFLREPQSNFIPRIQPKQISAPLVRRMTVPPSGSFVRSRAVRLRLDVRAGFSNPTIASNPPARPTLRSVASPLNGLSSGTDAHVEEPPPPAHGASINSSIAHHCSVILNLVFVPSIRRNALLVSKCRDNRCSPSLSRDLQLTHASRGSSLLNGFKPTSWRGVAFLRFFHLRPRHP